MFRSHLCRLSAVVALACSAAPRTAHALEAFCAPVDFCSLMPMEGGNPVENHPALSGYNPELAWVVAGSTTLNLAAGTYQAGPGLFGPTIFVAGDASIIIENQTEDVVLPATIFLCDRATFRVTNATYRQGATRPFEFHLWADDDSRVIFEHAEFRSLTVERDAASLPGAFLHVMQGHSTLTVTSPAPGEHGLTNRFGDAWELAVTSNAVATVNDYWGFAETYLAGQGSLTMEDSFFFDVFFEICPGATQNLPSLPDLCDLTDPVAGCITTGHAPLTFSVGPPATSFTLNLANDQVFSWALSTYPTSNASLSNVGRLANLAVGLGGATGTRTMLLQPGATPVFNGLDDRMFNFTNVHVGFWHFWPGAGINATLLPTSDVGDFSLPSGGAGKAIQTRFAGGALDVAHGGVMTVVNSVVEEPALIHGTASFTRTELLGTLSVSGTVWGADSTLEGTLDLQDGARVHQVALALPAEELITLNGPLAVVGSVYAMDGAGPLSPFPPAVLEYVHADGTTVLATFTSTQDATLLHTLQPSAVPTGPAVLQLRFTDPAAQNAIAERQVLNPVVSSSSSGAGSSAGVSSSAATSGFPVSSGVSSSAEPGSSGVLVSSGAVSSASSGVPSSSAVVVVSSSAALPSSSAVVWSSSAVASSSRAGSSGSVGTSTSGGPASSSAGNPSAWSGSLMDPGPDDEDNGGNACACAETPRGGGVGGALTLAVVGLLTARRRRVQG
jgi:MYXO-CTERM domain-containing protein